MAVSETLSLSRLQSPLAWSLLSRSVYDILCSQSPGVCALGPNSSKASIRHMQLQKTEGAEPHNSCGYCPLQKSRVTREPELEVLRQLQAEPQHANPMGPRGPLKSHTGLGVGNSLPGKYLSYSYLCAMKRQTEHIVREFQVWKTFQTFLANVLVCRQVTPGEEGNCSVGSM